MACGSPATNGSPGRDEMTLRAALLESSNAAAVLLQQRVGSGPVLRLARDLGVARSARRSVAGARQRPGHAARADGGVRRVSDAGVPRAAARNRVGRRTPQARTCTACTSNASGSCSEAGRVSDGLDARGRRRPRHRRGRAPVRRHRRGWRQDRIDQRLSRCLVRRLLVVGRRGRLGRASTSPSGSARAAPARAWRCRSGPTSCAAWPVSPGRADSRRRRICTPRNCACSRINVPSKGARPTSSTSRMATQFPCDSARSITGTFKQRAQRALEGFFTALGARD